MTPPNPNPQASERDAIEAAIFEALPAKGDDKVPWSWKDTLDLANKKLGVDSEMAKLQVAEVRKIFDAILSRMGAEPVAWQYRVMYDKGHAREKEWCEWHIISKKYYDIVCVEIASGKQRVQARKLYASPPAPALDARTVEALKNAMTLMEADDKIDAFNGTSSIARTRVLEQCRSALATRAYRGK